MPEKIKVDIAAMPPQYKRLLTRWVWNLLDQAMADPELWAKIQAQKEMMYQTGQLTRPEDKKEGAVG